MFNKIILTVLCSLVISVPVLAQDTPLKLTVEQSKQYMCILKVSNEINSLHTLTPVQNKTAKHLTAIIKLHKYQNRQDNWLPSLGVYGAQIQSSFNNYIQISCGIKKGDIHTAKIILDTAYTTFKSYLDLVNKDVINEFTTLKICSDQQFVEYNRFFKEGNGAFKIVWYKMSVEERQVYKSMYSNMMRETMLVCDRKYHQESSDFTASTTAVTTLVGYINHLKNKYSL